MAWITPIVTWTPSPVNNADLNRIEGNTKYLREENKTINGTTTLTSLLTISSSGITSSSSSIDLLKNTNINGDITQTTGVTSLKDTNIGDIVTNQGSELLQIAGATALLRLQGTVNTTAGNAASGIVLMANPTSSNIHWGIVEEQSNISLSFRKGNSPDVNLLTEVFGINWTTGNSIFGGGTDNGTDLLQVGSDSDISVSMGRGKLGYNGVALDSFFISHYDKHNGTDFALRAHRDYTVLNTKENGLVYINNGGSTPIATFGSSAINLYKDTTIDGSLSVNSGSNNTLFSLTNTSANSTTALISDATRQFSMVGNSPEDFKFIFKNYGTGNYDLEVRGDTTIEGLLNVKNEIILVGSNTGIANNRVMGFFESNGIVRQGYIGLPTGSNDDFYMYADTGNLTLQSANDKVLINSDTAIDGSLDVSEGISLETTLGAGDVNIGSVRWSSTTTTGAVFDALKALNVVIDEDIAYSVMGHFGTYSIQKLSYNEILTLNNRYELGMESINGTVATFTIEEDRTTAMGSNGSITIAI